MKDEKEKYTFLQFKEISLGRAHGLSEEEIKLYAKPSLNYLQMQIIREDLERGTDHEKVRFIAKPWLSIEEMLDLQQELTQKTVAEMPLLIRRRSLIFMILCLLVPLCSGIYLLYRHIHPADPLILKLREDAVTVSEGDIFEPSLYISDTSGRGAKLQMPERFTAEEPGTRLLVYRLHRGKEEVLRYLRVTTRENKAPVLILETDEISVQDGEELVFGSVSWDYSDRLLNINGRICLSMTLMWGLLGVAFSLLCAPAADRLFDLAGDWPVKGLCVMLSILMSVDLLVSAGALVRWRDRQYDLPAITPIGEQLDEHFDDERMEKIYNNMVFVEKEGI